jgi:penicillin-binding protein 2
MIQAIIISCDTYFFDFAHKMGFQRMYNILTQFGFGALSGIDMGEELPGIIGSPNWKKVNKGLPWYEGDTLNAYIGQGYMHTTPIQLAQGVATLANRGKRFQPHLLLGQEEVGKNKNLLLPITLGPVTLNNDSSWNTVLNAMKDVTSNPQGTAYRFYKDAPYTVAGKTGSAQVFSIKQRDKNENAVPQMDLPENLRDHSLFIAFAPFDQPTIAVAVVVENNANAGGIARKVIDYHLLGPPKPPVSTPPASATTVTPAATQPGAVHDTH